MRSSIRTRGSNTRAQVPRKLPTVTDVAHASTYIERIYFNLVQCGLSRSCYHYNIIQVFPSSTRAYVRSPYIGNSSAPSFSCMRAGRYTTKVFAYINAPKLFCMISNTSRMLLALRECSKYVAVAGSVSHFVQADTPLGLDVDNQCY